MQDEHVSILELALLGAFSVLSLVGLKFLHSSRSAIRFHPAPATEVPLWSESLAIVAVMAFFLFPGIIFVFSMAVEELLKGRFEQLPWMAIHITVSSLLGGGLVVFVIWQIVVGFLRQPAATLGLCGAPWANLLPVVLFFVLFFSPLLLSSFLWEYFLDSRGYELIPQEVVKMFNDAIAEGNILELSLLVFTAVVLAPLWEELIFRGFFFGLFRSRWGTVPALVFSSAVFAAIHLNLFALLPLFFVGLALGYIYYRTRSIYFAILFHALFNSVMLFIQWLLAGS